MKITNTTDKTPCNTDFSLMNLIAFIAQIRSSLRNSNLLNFHACPFSFRYVRLFKSLLFIIKLNHDKSTISIINVLSEGRTLRESKSVDTRR